MVLSKPGMDRHRLEPRIKTMNSSLCSPFPCKPGIPKANGKTAAPISITSKISKGVQVIVFCRCIKWTDHSNYTLLFDSPSNDLLGTSFTTKTFYRFNLFQLQPYPQYKFPVNYVNICITLGRTACLWEDILMKGGKKFKGISLPKTRKWDYWRFERNTSSKSNVTQMKGFLWKHQTSFSHHFFWQITTFKVFLLCSTLPTPTPFFS